MITITMSKGFAILVGVYFVIDIVNMLTKLYLKHLSNKELEGLCKRVERQSDIVLCDDCKHRYDCSQVVNNIEGTISTQLRWCSDGERIEE